MRRNKNYLENLSEYEIAKNKVQKLKRYYISLFFYCIGLTFYLLKEFGNIRFNFFPIHFLNWFVMSIWTYIIIAKTIKLYIQQSFFGSNWEQRKISKIMQKENQQTQKWS